MDPDKDVPQFYSLYVRHADGYSEIIADAGVNKLAQLRTLGTFLSLLRGTPLKEFIGPSLRHIKEVVTPFLNCLVTDEGGYFICEESEPQVSALRELEAKLQHVMGVCI
jgi:hypothetical protein